MSDVVLGTLYIVQCRTMNRATGETTKYKILLVGCEVADVERRLRWVLDYSACDELSITSVEKVREKAHVLSSVTTFPDQPSAVIDRDGQQQQLHAPPMVLHTEQMRLYALGLATTVSAVDERHAMRKVGAALANQGSAISSHAQKLSDGSTLTVEQVARSSGIARARDVSNEINKARIFKN